LWGIDVSAYFSFGGNERNSLFLVAGNCCTGCPIKSGMTTTVLIFRSAGMNVTPYFWWLGIAVSAYFTLLELM